MDNKEFDAWCVGIIKKRTPDALNVLSQILVVALAKGEVTANDVTERDYIEPNIIGATFKLLRKMGFTADWTRPTKVTTSKGHGRMIPIWVLEDPVKAQVMMAKIRNLFFDNDGEAAGGGSQGTFL